MGKFKKIVATLLIMGLSLQQVGLSTKAYTLNNTENNLNITNTTTENNNTAHTETTVTTDVYTDTGTTPASVVVTTKKTVVKSDANVALGTSILNVETGRQLTGKIGISVSDVPQTNDDQDGRPVIDYADRTAGGAIPYSTANVPVDMDGISLGMGDVSKKATGLAGESLNKAQVGQIVYLRSEKYDYTVSYADPDGNIMKIADLTPGANTIPGTQDPANIYAYAFRAAAGSTVEIPMPTYTGYAFGSATGAETPLTVATTGTDKGKVSGKTPAQNVDIVINFVRNQVTYKFDSQDGSSVTDKFEAVGTASTLGALPSPVKTGYTFNGWKEYTDTNGNGRYDAGTDTAGAAFTAYPVPSAPKTTYLYATWVPDGTLYHVTTFHKNTSASLSLTFGSEVDAGHVIDSQVDKDPTTVPGYKYGSGSAIPVSAGAVEPNPATTPGAQAGHYHINKMPASAVTLTYKYTVDPNAAFTFTVSTGDFHESPTALCPAK